MDILPTSIKYNMLIDVNYKTEIHKLNNVVIKLIIKALHAIANINIQYNLMD